MSFPNVVDLSSDEDIGEAETKTVILQSASFRVTSQQANHFESENVLQKFFENSNATVFQSGAEILDQGGQVADRPIPDSLLNGCSQPLCRKFWKAGDYNVGQASKTVALNGRNHIRVHPKFLHSNATSHKWALGGCNACWACLAEPQEVMNFDSLKPFLIQNAMGFTTAIAELLDNAIDETQNGATFASIDKITNSRDGSPALLIQDDGGGMDPESIRRCMSLGYSMKRNSSSIGQYGNGFKTSTMRLGADAIVFSRCGNTRACTQSIGLLSYTFLTRTSLEEIVVPMIDYEWSPVTGARRPLLRTTMEDFSCNLSTLLQWSPYSLEEELLKQFDEIGHRGTRIVVYNLWLNDDGELELDFESDKEDIQISGAPKIKETHSFQRMKNQRHVANRFRYSLREYSSILYLQMPKNFRIILRGRAVEHRSIANDLKFTEYILYRPQIGENKEVSIITTIGFLKDAPHLNVHGFNVYHKNRLILPFWRVVHEGNSRGRGVAGVLEANFIEPAHDKQDFERTSLFQKLETRLRQMTVEYWGLHCGLIGYHEVKKPRTASVEAALQDPPISRVQFPAGRQIDLSGSGKMFDGYRAAFQVGKNLRQVEPAVTAVNLFPAYETEKQFPAKRKMQNNMVAPEPSKRIAMAGADATESGQNHNTQLGDKFGSLFQSEEAKVLMAENKKLLAQCAEYDKLVEERQLKVKRLEGELQEVQREYAKLLIESQSFGPVKGETL